ncbi:MAG: uracil-DNA glycosylase [Gammaproteobacteria bacterium]|nr:uracil-DNA glycosylase [Gammaproteobacteria bacterium]
MLTARQQHCLRGIGIQVWSERGSAPGDRLATGSVAAVAESEQGVPETGDRPGFSENASPAASDPRQKRSQSPVIEDPATEAAEAKSTNPPVLDSWDQIIDAIHACSACELSQNCTQKVPGVGSHDARLLIVGEGPGHDEDIRGEPFVGRSGQLLDRMLAAIGIARDQVYITNIVKCRPPNNRDPKPAEAQACRSYLDAQIRQLAPRVILSVGRVSAHNLLGSNQPVGKLIQQMHQLPGTDIPVKVTYHPAYLLRNPSAKAIAWQDLKLLHQLLQ